ncbi:MAG: glycoside hydrolase family 65 protein [Candidatus Merdivicinus sp.]|jgi:trehalose/maltose hydrolase-like predicted phosphorylase
MPINPFVLAETRFDPSQNKKNETLFTQANGYIGFRGNFEESLPDSALSTEGTYLNGFYESEKILYGESAYAFPDKGQTLLNVLNAKVIKTFVDGCEVQMNNDGILGYSRRLDMENGVLFRDFTLRTASGKELAFHIKRLVSLTNKNLAAISYSVTALNFSGPIRILSAIDGDVTNMVAEDDPRVGAGFSGRVLSITSQSAGESSLRMAARTKNTRFTVACAAEHTFSPAGACTAVPVREEALCGLSFEVDLTQGTPFVLEKFIGYADDKFCPTEEALRTAEAAAKTGAEKGFSALLSEQRAYLREFWDSADVVIEGNDELNQAMKLNLFQLLQSVGRDGRTNIAAKGLSGEGYEGHYFWDTETYILPFFLYTNPEISRKLLEYRYSILPKARERARQMAHPIGALYAWRTIDGEECSAYFPAGTAQYHINADIAFAVKRYFEATGDWDFMERCGAEILAETARLWADLGCYPATKGGKFCINEVTGPDEYTACVNNNYYTNLMARENLLFAAEIAETMKAQRPEAYAALAEKIGLADGEPAVWKEDGEKMYLPYDEERGICLQDDTFLDKEPWDFANTPKENYPLLMHYHPLVIYRHQVCKQADTVLAEFLLSSRFSREQKQRDYDFYEPLTTHDSSLSAAIFSIIACETGKSGDAFQHFRHTALTDLCDLHRNTKDGIHAASMAGSWMCVVNGFAGLRTDSGMPVFQTVLPEELTGYRFKFRYRGSLLEISVDRSGSRISLLSGPAITVRFNGEDLNLQ